MRIEVYIIPIFVLISVIALGIIIYIEEVKDKTQGVNKDKEKDNE
tara:strand:- start:17 stop:151 length:135 start_codon:yes stop_codon:yes gene_type:complete